MEGILKKSFFSKIKDLATKGVVVNNLSQGKVNRDYRIESIEAKDEGMSNFLFSLGCYEGEMITIISIICDNYVINIKDARYSIDKELAKVIRVQEI